MQDRAFGTIAAHIVDLKTAVELIDKAKAIREQLADPRNWQGYDGMQAAGYAEGLRIEADAALAYARRILEALAKSGEPGAGEMLAALPPA